MRAEDPETEQNVPEGEASPPPLRPEYENVEQYVDDVDRERQDGNLNDRVDERADDRRETLRGGADSAPGT